VERSDTHQLHFCGDDGFRMAQPILRDEPSNSEAARHVRRTYPLICPTGSFPIRVSSPFFKKISVLFSPKSKL
jgi:hypothetical protein